MRLFSDAASAVDDPYLRRAFELAERGRGTTSPNPLVGCVIVRDGEVVGEGWHERAGGPHAEVNALADAGDAARGATAYVTLEPCAHTGRTGPCTVALRQAGVSAVVVGMRDPNPEVAGEGAEVLKGAGIDVRFAEDPTPFEEQNEAWLKRVHAGVPWVVAKVALTLDGRLALQAGERSAITGAGGAEITRRLRAAADAVLVGVSTAKIDDPALTVRDAEGRPAARQPLRVVLGRSSAPPPDLGLFTDGAGPSAVLLPADDLTRDVVSDVTAAEDALQPRLLRYDSVRGLEGALRVLAEAGVTTLLVEPGARLFESLWREDAVDELVVVTAGRVAGGEGVALFPGAGGQTGRMRPAETGIIEDDAVTVWRRRERE